MESIEAEGFFDVIEFNSSHRIPQTPNSFDALLYGPAFLFGGRLPNTNQAPTLLV